MTSSDLVRTAELDPDAIRAAHATIPAAFTRSPQYVHEGLSAALGVPVILKVETANPIRSFKGRGTWVAVAALVGEGRVAADRPVVCVSAGNFGQGVAYAARAHGVPALVFCSTRASRVAGPRAVELMAGRVDEMRTVSEADLHAGQATLTAELGITVEGAAAASWAGVLAGPRPDGPVVVIITGSNV